MKFTNPLVKTLSWLAVFVLVTLSFYWISDRYFTPKPPEPKLLLEVDPATDYLKGALEAPNTLVEYSDFACDACAAYYPTLKKLGEEMGDSVRIVYRYFPVQEQHPNALLASQVAAAAAKQGKFWQMHDLLFEKQTEWVGAVNFQSVAEGYAGQLELDIEQFKTDMVSEEVAQRVQGDQYGGLASQVRAAPTFFLNGTLFTAPPDEESFRQALAEKLAE